MRIISLLTRETIIFRYSLIFGLIIFLAQVDSGYLGGTTTGVALSDPDNGTTITNVGINGPTSSPVSTISPVPVPVRWHDRSDTSEHDHKHHSLTPATIETSIYSTTSNPNDTIHHNKTPSTYLSSRIKGPRKVCPGVHIRNDLKSFEQLRGCEIIDGPLTIALVSNQTHPFEPKDYENITFPQLTEITEYLLFFRVEGLTKLSGLLPNLAVIRGKRLVSNYALIIYEMMHLQKINLPKLTDILEGAVRIENNPNLCYVSTVNWEGICKYVAFSHFIKGNNPRCNNRCPENCRPWTSRVHSDPALRLEGDVHELGAENDRSTFCWSGQTCHESCPGLEGVGLPLSPNGGCCSSQCAGGCYIEDRSDQCISCRHVSQDDKCVSHCDKDRFEYKGRCISEETCRAVVEAFQHNQCGKSIDYSSHHLKAVNASHFPNGKHGRCQTTCPPGSEEDPLDKHICKPCDKGKCRKVCTPPEGSEKPFMVTNLNSLKELSGCNVINGSLDISLNGGKNVLPELEEAFKELEEIRGYLKITRSYPLLTLGFLPELKAINGSNLDRGLYSLIIIDNPNLQELFPFNVSSDSRKQLKISGGKIFVHLNPKLCPHKIDNLKRYASVADWDESDVSPHTNGDKEACNTEKLEVEFGTVSAKVAMIKIQTNFAAQMDDPRSLLYYLINYREATSGNVTMFDGRDGCNSQNDVWTTLEEAPIPLDSFSNKSLEKFQEVIIQVKPATRYALYVKTFTILAGTKGALSDIIYFETAPDTPTMPRDIQSLAKGHDNVMVSWLPPIKPNGKIERYLVTITRTPDLDDVQNIDICDSIHDRDKITSTLPKEEPDISTISTTSSSTETTQTDMSASCSKPSDRSALSLEVITFQDNIIDIVYLKQTCPANPDTNKNVKKKRSINYELKDSDTNSATITSKPHDRVSPESPTSTGNNVSNHDIKYDRGQEKTTITIDAGVWKPHDRLTAVINNLEHYSLYRVEILACHGEYVSKSTKPEILISKSYRKCSLQAITHVRTHPIEINDKVQRSSMAFYPANETVADNLITWKAPERPNGIVLAYRVRYRLKNGHPELWTEGCVNTTTFSRDNGFVLSSASPGNYLFSVQTVSLYAGQRLWSEELEFEIPRNYIISPIIALMLLMAIIILIFLAIFSGTYYYRMKKHHVVDYASVNPDYINYKPDEWEVDRANLLLGSQIGTGSFGMVYKGELISEKGRHLCAIKTVPPTSTTKQRMDFLREASIMKEFDTYHVVKLMGVVSISTPVYVIMEFMENGDLKEFLRKQREIHQREKKPLVDGIYLMASQIADGMAYLASKKFVHRDLAARNCMVGENRVVKVGDFGLTRDIYANDYYRRDTQGRLPVRWMAPESLSDNIYTSASDVWSYGIVVWEIVTFSAYPYQGLSNDEVIKKVTQGYSMSRPDNCPNKLFNLMERCWRRNPDSRPSFNEIVEYLLPETEGKLYPNCFYRKQKTEGNSIAQSMPEEHSNTGTESYPLLSWPSNRANGLTNGVNQMQSDSGDRNH